MSMKKYFTSKLRIVVLSLLLCSSIGVLYAAWSDWYRVDLSQNVEIQYNSAVWPKSCVQNAWGVAPIFVPTMTTAEWTSFVNYKPPGINIAGSPWAYCTCEVIARYACGMFSNNWCTWPWQVGVYAFAFIGYSTADCPDGVGEYYQVWCTEQWTEVCNWNGSPGTFCALESWAYCGQIFSW